MASKFRAPTSYVMTYILFLVVLLFLDNLTVVLVFFFIVFDYVLCGVRAYKMKSINAGIVSYRPSA
jgi:hypothetical protein